MILRKATVESSGSSWISRPHLRASSFSLPSVRELASQLVINPNTIQRAYRELEHEGYIVSVPGKGSFARQADGADSARRAELLGAFDDAVEELMYLGVTADELRARIDERAVEHGEN